MRLNAYPYRTRGSASSSPRVGMCRTCSTSLTRSQRDLIGGRALREPYDLDVDGLGVRCTDCRCTGGTSPRTSTLVGDVNDRDHVPARTQTELSVGRVMPNSTKIISTPAARITSSPCSTEYPPPK